VLGMGLIVRLRAGMSALLHARVRTLHAKIKHLRSPLRLVLDTLPALAVLCLHPRSICTPPVSPQPTLCSPPKCILMCMPTAAGDISCIFHFTVCFCVAIPVINVYVRIKNLRKFRLWHLRRRRWWPVPVVPYE
jgi:hypothetical protein